MRRVWFENHGSDMQSSSQRGVSWRRWLETQMQIEMRGGTDVTLPHQQAAFKACCTHTLRRPTHNLRQSGRDLDKTREAQEWWQWYAEFKPEGCEVKAMTWNADANWDEGGHGCDAAPSAGCIQSLLSAHFTPPWPGSYEAGSLGDDLAPEPDQTGANSDEEVRRLCQGLDEPSSAVACCACASTIAGRAYPSRVQLCCCSTPAHSMHEHSLSAAADPVKARTLHVPCLVAYRQRSAWQTPLRQYAACSHSIQAAARLAGHPGLQRLKAVRWAG